MNNIWLSNNGLSYVEATVQILWNVTMVSIIDNIYSKVVFLDRSYEAE